MSAIIFDFDGTIIDSFDFVVNLLAAEAGLGPLGDAERQQLRSKSMYTIGRSMGHSWLKLLKLFFKGRQLMGVAIRQMQPFAGLPELIKKLHNEGHELFILTTNSVPNVRAFLHHQKLHKYFLEIYGSISLFGKTPALRKLLKENNIEVKDAIYIGDELRDVEAAQALKLRVVAVDWGFARAEDLKNLKPTAFADTPAELLAYLETI